MRRIWTHADVASVVTRYHREGPTRLAREFGRSESSVSSLARRYGQKTPRRKYRRRRNTTAEAP